jgi:ATP-dependent DNA helicase
MGTAHPELLVRASGKFALLDRMLERLHRDGHQCLIFSQMTKVLNVMEDYLRFRGWQYCRIDGSTNIDERQRQMDVFNAEKTSGLDGARNESDDRNFVFLLSTRAGGLGINLTAADTCILFDSDFNPFNDSQAMGTFQIFAMSADSSPTFAMGHLPINAFRSILDRCHRLGQTHPVAVYRLLTVNSVDIEMMERQISKKKLERMTIAGGDFRRAGTRSKGNLSFEYLSKLLESDVKDMSSKGVEDIRISDEEFEMILDRKRLFATGESAIPMDGKMYSVIEAASGDLLGSMNSAADTPGSAAVDESGDADLEANDS